MKYIRTKDGVFEADKTVFGKHTKIVLTNKKTGETINEIVCDYIEEKSIIEDMLFAEYCKTHKLNPLDYARKTIVVNPSVIAQADTIEELCDTKVAIRKSDHKPYLGHLSGNYFFQEDLGWLGRIDSYESIYGAIWIKGEHGEPILKSVAKMKGVLPNGEIDWELL